MNDLDNTCHHREGSLIRCPVCLGPTNRLGQWEYECAAALTDCSVISFTIEASTPEAKEDSR